MVDWVPLSLHRRRLPPGFRRRVVTIEPGGIRLYNRSEWRRALVLVERGHIDIETRDGSRYGFGPGKVLWLDELPVRSLRNPGRLPAVLVAVSRRATDSF